MSSSAKRKQVTIRFLHRTVLFLFSFLIALCALFVLGNVQSFLDSSQLIILRFLIGTGSLLFILSLFSLLVELYYIFHLRSARYLGHCVLSGITCVAGLGAAILAATILLLSNGVQLS